MAPLGPNELILHNQFLVDLCVSSTHILQGCPLALGQSNDCPNSASEVTLITSKTTVWRTQQHLANKQSE